MALLELIFKLVISRGWSVDYIQNVKVVFQPLEKGYVLWNNGKKNAITNINDVNFKPGFYKQIKSFIDLTDIKNIYPSQNIKQIIKPLT